MARQSKESGPETVTAVERAFSVLRAVAASNESMGVSAIARTIDLPKSTVARLLATLETLEVVERVDEAGRYDVGPGLAVLVAGSPGTGRLREVARPYLRELVAEVGEDAGLAVGDGTEVLFIDQVQCDSQVQVQDWTGWRFPYHTVAAGFVLMTGWSQERLAGYLDGELEAFTEATPTDPGEVRARVRVASRDGYVWTRRTFADDVNGAAAPVLAKDGHPVGAVTLYGPTYRFPDGEESKLGNLVRETGSKISDHLAQVSGS